MDIIFSCFSVLLICTWAIQHLSVQPHKTHFWNHKIIKSKQYSAFLDDARFNYTKLKWMGISPRSRFTEWRKAQKLPKQSDQKDWTTTQGYFANMGGFILRFDVEAVKIPLEPRKPDEFERSLFKRNPDEDPPYLPQSLVDAEAQELKPCHQGAPCENHPDGPHVDRDGSSRGGDSDAQPPSAVSENHPLLQVVVDSQGRTTALERIQGPLSSENSPEDLLKFTPSTLIQMPGVSSISTPVSVVNRHGFPMNSTPITAISDHQYPFPAKDTSTANGSEYELRRLDATDAVHSHSNLQSPNPTAVRKEKERLIPHKIWQATWALSSMQMLYAILKGIIPLPDTSAEDLNDRSKGDALVKGLAVLHITWLVIQILARGVEGMAITQLEIMILGFSACALVTYFLLWHKPQDVKIPTYIDIPQTLTREQIIQLAARSPVATLMVHQFWLHGVAIRAMADNVFPWTPGIKFQLPLLMEEPIFLNPHLVGIGGGGALFGGIDVAAWNFTFPTYVEKLLWRISASYLLAIPLIGTIIYCFVQHFIRRHAKGTDTKVDNVLRPIGRVAATL